MLTRRDNLSMGTIKMCIHAVVGGIYLGIQPRLRLADYTTIYRDEDTFCITSISIL